MTDKTRSLAGTVHVALGTAPLDVAAVSALVSSHGSGGISLFIGLRTRDSPRVSFDAQPGTTRDHFEGKRVLRLEYEAYPAMAERHLRRIGEAMVRDWGCAHVALVHRLGVVPVGEASVVVAAGAVHRKEAMAAVVFGIDELKARVPVWKKEVYEEGASQWKANCECAVHQRARDPTPSSLATAACESAVHERSYEGASHWHATNSPTIAPCVAAQALGPGDGQFTSSHGAP